MIKNGLKPNKKDHRDYSYFRTFGSTILSRVPDEFDFDAHLTMPDQNADGLYQACTAYAQTDICVDEDKVVYPSRPLYDYTLQVMGIKPTNPLYEKIPCDIRSSLKAVKELYKRLGYFDILDNKPFDAFDSIRMVMDAQKRTVTIGTPWSASWEYPAGGVVSGFDFTSTDWHNYKISGFKKINGILYAIVKSWQGKGIGDGGLLYFPREIINSALSMSGSFAYTLVPPETAPGEIQTVDLGFWATALSKLAVFIKSLTKPKMDVPPTIPAITETSPAPIQVATTYLWDTKEHAIHSCRVLMDEYNLNWTAKALLCSTIEGESNFNTQAKNENKKNGEVWSTDWGICQINDYYNIGPGKPFASVDEVLNDPEKSVRFMVEMYQQGHLDYWDAFKSGAYKKNLDKYLAYNPQ